MWRGPAPACLDYPPLQRLPLRDGKERGGREQAHPLETTLSQLACPGRSPPHIDQMTSQYLPMRRRQVAADCLFFICSSLPPHQKSIADCICVQLTKCMWAPTLDSNGRDAIQKGCKAFLPNSSSDGKDAHGLDSRILVIIDTGTTFLSCLIVAETIFFLCKNFLCPPLLQYALKCRAASS